jgi:hypothetical protein
MIFLLIEQLLKNRLRTYCFVVVDSIWIFGYTLEKGFFTKPKKNLLLGIQEDPFWFRRNRDFVPNLFLITDKMVPCHKWASHGFSKSQVKSSQVIDIQYKSELRMGWIFFGEKTMGWAGLTESPTKYKNFKKYRVFWGSLWKISSNF